MPEDSASMYDSDSVFTPSLIFHIEPVQKLVLNLQFPELFQYGSEPKYNLIQSNIWFFTFSFLILIQYGFKPLVL